MLSSSSDTTPTLPAPRHPQKDLGREASRYEASPVPKIGSRLSRLRCEQHTIGKAIVKHTGQANSNSAEMARGSRLPNKYSRKAI